jgi:flagellar protein FlbD
MIPLHRLTHPDEDFWLNPDAIRTLEATPDTVITLDNDKKLLVMESPEEIAELIRDWRAGIIRAADEGKLIHLHQR